MRKPITSTLALIAVSALPLIAVAPASAAIPRNAFTFDCNVGPTGESDHALAPGEFVTITLLNCDNGYEITDQDLTGNAMLGSVVLTTTPIVIATDPATVVVHEFAEVYLEGEGAENININLSTTTADPAGDLLATTSTTLTEASDFFTTPDTAEILDGDALIGGIVQCDVEVGSHPYSTVDLTITEAGTYTFRVVDTDPVEEDMYYGIDSDFSPVGDNFLALYTEFDSADINADIVGCNDDADDAGAVAGDLWATANAAGDSRGQGDSNIHTSTGYILDDQFAWFTATLQPGQYTMVGTLYSEYSESEWLTNLDDAEVTQASLTYEMWGPEGGLVLGLADTGVDPAFGLWTGLALAGTGAAITVARRRAQRA